MSCIMSFLFIVREAGIETQQCPDRSRLISADSEFELELV